MTEDRVEVRVAALEKEMAALIRAIANGAHEKDWRSTVGMFSGDEVMKRIDAAALAYREADRRKARSKTAKRRVKS